MFSFLPLLLSLHQSLNEHTDTYYVSHGRFAATQLCQPLKFRICNNLSIYHTFTISLGCYTMGIVDQIGSPRSTLSAQMHPIQVLLFPLIILIPHKPMYVWPNQKKNLKVEELRRGLFLKSMKSGRLSLVTLNLAYILKVFNVQQCSDN